MNSFKLLFFAVFLVVTIKSIDAQNPLNRTISLQVNRQRLDNVLEIISNKGDFYFSYSSNIIKKDTLVSFNYANKSVSFILKN